MNTLHYMAVEYYNSRNRKLEKVTRKLQRIDASPINYDVGLAMLDNLETDLSLFEHFGKELLK